MSEKMDRIIFEDLEPKEVEVSIQGKEYLLVEASADVEVKFHDSMSREMSLDSATKKMKIGAVNLAQPLAVSKSLFELKQLGLGKLKRVPVPLDTLLRWPPRVYQKLFKILSEMSPGLERGTDKEEEQQKEKEKNLPSSGDPTSDSAASSEFPSISCSDGDSEESHLDS